MSGRGKSPGTGSPLTFRCGRCKICRGRDSDRGTNWEATGELRRRRAKRSGIRHDANHEAAYHCLDCGHSGWSRHESVIRAAGREVERKALVDVRI